MHCAAGKKYTEIGFFHELVSERERITQKNDLVDEILNAKTAHEYINIQYIWIYINKFKSFINSLKFLNSVQRWLSSGPALYCSWPLEAY